MVWCRSLPTPTSSPFAYNNNFLPTWFLSLSDNLLLLQTFASRVRFVSGQALHDITDRLSGNKQFHLVEGPRGKWKQLAKNFFWMNKAIGHVTAGGKKGFSPVTAQSLSMAIYSYSKWMSGLLLVLLFKYMGQPTGVPQAHWQRSFLASCCGAWTVLEMLFYGHSS